MVKLSLYWPLLARMVKFVASNVTFVTPEIPPVELSNESPDGSEGEMAQSRTSPPSMVANLEREVTLVVKISSEYG